MDNISMIIVLFSAFCFGSFVVYIIRCDIFVANFSSKVREVYELNEDICNKISTLNNEDVIQIGEKFYKKVVVENENFVYVEVSKKDLTLDGKSGEIELLESLEDILQKLSVISQRIDGFVVYNSNIQKEKDLLQKMKNKVNLLKWQIESKTEKELD